MNAISKNPESRILHIRVLGYKEDGEWVALALEMDLRGFGATFVEALDELRGSVEAQVFSAVEAGHPEAILFPAEQKWFDKWEEIFRSVVTSSLSKNAKKSEEYNLADLPFPFWNSEAPGLVHVGA